MYEFNRKHKGGFNKIFGIGENKTGTTSLGVALNVLGCGQMAAWPQSKHIINGFRSSYTDMFSQMNVVCRMYRHFNDFPWNILDLYQMLDKRFINSKFILTVRDPECWFKSLKNWCTVPSGNYTDLMWRIHKNFRRDRRYRRVIGLFEKCFEQKYGIKSNNGVFRVSEYKDKYIKGYINRNKMIKKYFERRPNDLLVVNWEDGDGWEELCNFLNRKIPSRRFPHALKRKFNNKYYG